ncbi:MAG: vWA domain-containing protein [Planctomycetota bacterium]|jgi:hypothetical protein
MIFVDYPGHSVAVLLLAVFAVLVFVTFRLGGRQNAKLLPYRMPLILLHYAAILILLLILWNPSRAKISETLSNNSVLAIFDTSRSMSVVEDGQSTRLDRALSLFEEKFHPLDKDGAAYRVFGFDRQSYHSGSADFLRRWGLQTDMHTIFATLGKYDTKDYYGKEQSAQKSKVVGAVIFTDGQANDKNVETYLPLTDQDFQTIFVGIGSKDKQTDIAIASINAPAQMAIDTACNISVAVAARNLRDKSVTIELLKDDYVIDSTEIAVDRFALSSPRPVSGDTEVTVHFTVGADRLGSCALSARAVAAEDEVNQANNVRSTVIEIVEEARLRVLFYSQVANFNIGKVRQVLARDEKIQLDLGLDVVRTPALAEKASKASGYVKLPGDRAGFYEYDIIVLGPCDLEALTKTQVDSLYSFVVDRGGGLILLPGKADFGPAAWINRKAKSLVPVVFDLDEPTIWPASPGDIELTLEAMESKLVGPEVLKDYDEQALPYYRIPHSKPASTTLISIEDTPVVSIHRVGRGRVCLLNATQLFRWYREDLQGGPLCKIMAALTANLGRITSREAGVELFAERAAEQTNKVRFEAYVCDDSFDPVGGANVLLSLGEDIVSMHHRGQGHYVAEVENIKDQAILATAQAEADGVFLGEKTIAVNLPPVRGEMANIELDEGFLEALAKKVNGKYVHADDVDENVAQMFEARASTGSLSQMTSIWPNWLLLAILCILLTIGWFIRRSIGLV